MSTNKEQDRINETQAMNNGQKATIIAYRGSADIDVRFEDGTIVSNKTYNSFKNGNIKNPNNHIDEVRQMHNGMKATIIAYRSSPDIDIQFEDGTIVYHKQYVSFLNGCIKNPNIRLNEARQMNNGQSAVIKEYRKATDIDVEFEDGTIVTHRSYNAFLNGSIRNPNKISDRELNKKHNKPSVIHKGEERTMNNGEKATIIAYRSFKDIDVQFEDGTVISHRIYGEFKKGSIMKPKKNEIRVMYNGQKAKIIEYRNCFDIDIQFDDGTIVKHKIYNNFKRGLIRNPNFKQQEIPDEKDEDYDLGR